MAMERWFLTSLLLCLQVNSLHTVGRFCDLRHHHQHQQQQHSSEYRTTTPILERPRHYGVISVRHPSSTALFGEMRIRIHGTKNAYTTLRPYDCVLYSLTESIDEKYRSIGMYTASNEVLPLCTYEEWSTEFYVYKAQQPLSAEQLNSENRILRVVSCDRRGSECFIIEEYLDRDIHIPLSSAAANILPVEITEAMASEISAAAAQAGIGSAAPPAAFMGATASAVQDLTNLQTMSNSALDHTLDIVTAQLEASTLRVQLAQLRGEKSRRSAAGEADALLPTVGPSPSLLKSTPSSTSTLASMPTAAVIPAVATAPVAIHTDLAPAAVGPYSQAVVAGGFVFVSGCISLDMQTGRIAEGGVGAEARCALENLRNVLAEAGVTDMSKVCKTTLMIREMAYFPEVNKIYGDYFKADVKPARSTFEVSYLPLGAFIEIDAIAAL